MRHCAGPCRRHWRRGYRDPGGLVGHRRAAAAVKRTGLSAPLPAPVTGTDLSPLKEMLNVTATSWPLLVAWLVSCLIPNIPHPVLLLRGEQGTGKTSAMRLLGKLIDPST